MKILKITKRYIVYYSILIVLSPLCIFVGGFLIVWLICFLLIEKKIKTSLIIDTNNMELIYKEGKSQTKINLNEIEKVSFDKRKDKGDFIIIGSNGNKLTFSRYLLVDNGISEANFSKFLCKNDSDNYLNISLLSIEENLFNEKDKDTKIISIIILFISLLIIGVFAVFEIYTLPLFPIVDIPILYYPIFYLAIMCIALIVCLFVINKKYFMLKRAYTISFLILLFPLSFWSFLSNVKEPAKISVTREIDNYEKIQGEVNFTIAPEKIDEKMKIIEFNYYNNHYWDGIYELYLEVEIEDEQSYLNYSSSYEKIECWYAKNYREYVLKNEIEIDKENISSARVYKVLFNDDENKIIFIELKVLDHYFKDDCYYFNKFNIDINEYIEH